MAVDEAALETIFAAHTAHGWQDRPVPESLLRRMVDLAGMGPTAFNQQPLRVILVTSAEGKARLAPAMSRGNRDKTMAAPVTAILCRDLGFWRNLPDLWPAQDVRGFYDGRPEAALASATRNATLQAGYLVLAARALGLGAGPMSGFDAAAVTAAFLDGPDRAEWQVDFLMNIGFADPAANRPRLPRLGFDRIARMA
ncbi:MAG: malonic semialdehyde reductase [Paracoccaceae bacterium]|nr:MAG: malonic semialdehyde reductase [Paracoccaceae bacterium]